MEGQSEETFEAFWKEYSETETRVYEYILSHKDAHLSGTFSELVSKFKADPVIFMGFLDGINTSLREANDLEKIQEDTTLDLDVDYDKLFSICSKPTPTISTVFPSGTMFSPKKDVPK